MKLHYNESILPQTGRNRAHLVVATERDVVAGELDKTLLQTASYDGKARLWDLASGKLSGKPLKHAD